MPTTIAKTSSRLPEIHLDIEVLKTIVMVCAVGLTVSLMVMSDGVDLSPGFF